MDEGRALVDGGRLEEGIAILRRAASADGSNPDPPALLAEIYGYGVVDTGRIEQRHQSIAIRQGNREDIVPVGRVYEPSEARNVIGSRVGALRPGPAGAALVKVTLALFRPNLVFDAGETEPLIRSARNDVARTVGFVQENERIVARHEKITPEMKMKLDSFLRAKAERTIDSGAWRYWVGNALHVGVIISLFGIHLVLFRRGVVRDDGKLVLIAIIFLLQGLLAWLTVWAETPQPVQYLVLVPAASMLLTIIFDSRIGFFGTVMSAFIVAGVRGNDYGMAFCSYSHKTESAKVTS